MGISRGQTLAQHMSLFQSGGLVNGSRGIRRKSMAKKKESSAMRHFDDRRMPLLLKSGREIPHRRTTGKLSCPLIIRKDHRSISRGPKNLFLKKVPPSAYSPPTGWSSKLK